MVKSHVECSSELVWQCVKKNNAYVRASVNRTRLSAEKGNVTAKHGFSSSGACLCIFFYFLLSLLSCGSSSFSSRFEKGRARAVRRAGRPPRKGSLSLFFFLSLSLSRERVREATRAHTLLSSTDKNDLKLGWKKKRKREKKREKKQREAGQEKERKKITEERRRKKRALETRARVSIERKKARRSCRFPQKNIKFEDEIGMSASGSARSDQFERKDAFAR